MLVPAVHTVTDSAESSRPTLTSTPAAFARLSTHDGLVDWSKAYAQQVVRRNGVTVDLSRVDWEVSTRAKRRAAAVKRPKIPGAMVGNPLDWAAAHQRLGRSSRATTTDETEPRTCTVSLTWDAAVAFDYEEWAATLRHELIHVEQFQRFGTTDHGPTFKRRAEALDTPVRCRRFATPKFVLRCTDCDEVAVRRYRDCKLVREHDRYRSSCCQAPLRCQRFADQ